MNSYEAYLPVLLLDMGQSIEQPDACGALQAGDVEARASTSQAVVQFEVMWGRMN